MKAIVVENLTKKYGSYIAVDNLSFQVKKGIIRRGASASIYCLGVDTKTGSYFF